jgi:Leucine-rich repeat (LRR) protein
MQLEYLSLRNNRLTQLESLGRLTQLQRLYRLENQLTQLRELDLRGNPLAELPESLNVLLLPQLRLEL